LATKNGGWGVDYTELESVNPQLKIGSKLKVGDWVGIPNHPKDSEGFPKYRMIHWQFGYSDYIIPSKVQKRLCPLTYFSPSDRTTVLIFRGARASMTWFRYRGAMVSLLTTMICPVRHNLDQICFELSRPSPMNMG